MIDLRCPGCDFSPVERARYTPGDDLPETFLDVLDEYEVGGADEGNVICPRCSQEFDVLTGLPYE